MGARGCLPERLSRCRRDAREPDREDEEVELGGDEEGVLRRRRDEARVLFERELDPDRRFFDEEPRRCLRRLPDESDADEVEEERDVESDDAERLDSDEGERRDFLFEPLDWSWSRGWLLGLPDFWASLGSPVAWDWELGGTGGPFWS